jgi:xRRM domain
MDITAEYMEHPKIPTRLVLVIQNQCHVRLSSPVYAKLLVDYFTINRVVQVYAQDAKGREGEAQGWTTAQVQCILCSGRRFKHICSLTRSV